MTFRLQKIHSRIKLKNQFSIEVFSLKNLCGKISLLVDSNSSASSRLQEKVDPRQMLSSLLLSFLKDELRYCLWFLFCKQSKRGLALPHKCKNLNLIRPKRDLLLGQNLDIYWSSLNVFLLIRLSPRPHSSLNTFANEIKIFKLSRILSCKSSIPPSGLQNLIQKINTKLIITL